MEKTQYVLLARELQKVETLTNQMKLELDTVQVSNKNLEAQLQEAYSQGEELRTQVSALQIQLNEALSRLQEKEKQCQDLDDCNRKQEELIHSLENQLEAVQQSHIDFETLKNDLMATQIKLEGQHQDHNKALQTHIQELQEQTNKALAQATSSHERLLEYEQLLEEAVKTNKALEAEHQVCLDELQATVERNNTLETSLSQLQCDMELTQTQLQTYQMRGQELQERLQTTSNDLQAAQKQLQTTSNTLQEAQVQIQTLSAEVADYVTRKKRLLHIREQTQMEFQSVLQAVDRSNY